MRRPSGYWTLERLQEDAQKYQTRKAWEKCSGSAYQTARKQGLLEECCEHMDELRNHKGYWTLERLKKDALQYQSRSAWRKGSSAAYTTAFKQGLLEECCGHMESQYRPSGYWTLERLKSDALRFHSRRDWEKCSGSAYSAARKKGLLEKFCGHMDELRKPNGYWTLERLKKDALQYQSRNEWRLGSKSAYGLALRKGLMDECCGHMKKQQKDNDTVYFWKAEGTEFYKIGVTSARLGMQRINAVANASGFTPVLLAMSTVNDRATAIESELLRKFDRSAGLEGFNGSTEFRHLAAWEAAEVVATLAEAGN